KLLVNSADETKPAHIRLQSTTVPGVRGGHALLFRGDNSVTIPGVGDYTRTHPFTFSIWLKLTAPMERAVVVHHSRSGLDAASRGYELILENMKPSFALCHFWPGNAVRIRTK